MYRSLTFLQAAAESAPARTVQGQEDFSAKRAVWLLIQEAEHLDETQQHDLAFIRQASTQVEQAYQLAQAFTRMLRHRQGHLLEEWLQQVLTSSLPELRQFAAGIQRAKAAVQAGLTLPYSTGLVEGHINRLNLIKRESGMGEPSLISCGNESCAPLDSLNLRQNPKLTAKGNIYGIKPDNYSFSRRPGTLPRGLLGLHNKPHPLHALNSQ